MHTREEVRTSAASLLSSFHEEEGRFLSSGGADVPSFEGILHPNFVLVEPRSGPYGGEYHGRDGLLRFLGAMTDDWVDMAPQGTPELVEQDDTVVALATVQARSRVTQRLVAFPIAQVAKVEDGLLAETRVYYWDPTEMNDALRVEPSVVDPAKGENR